MRRSFHQILATIALGALALLPAARRADAAPDKVVVFLAMPGAGKSTVAKALSTKTKNAPMWSSGDVIRNAVAEKFGVYNIENDKAMRLEFAKRPGSVGELVAAAVKKAEGPLGIVEGFRTPEDLKAFKQAFPNAQIVAIEVGTQRRYGRMLARGRAGETSTKILRERDASEIKLGVRRAMKLANIRLRPQDGPAALDRSITHLMGELALDTGLPGGI